MVAWEYLRFGRPPAGSSSHSEEESLREVWALDVTPDDEYIITGGTDSRINVLKDFTGVPDPNQQANSPQCNGRDAHHFIVILCCLFCEQGIS